MEFVLSTNGHGAANPAIEAKIREFVARDILFSEDGYPHPDDASFLQAGVIDSLGVVELVTFAGRQFGIEVAQGDVTPQNFDSVGRLAAFIRRKQLASTKEPCVSS
jgi:acyl carrier protein